MGININIGKGGFNIGVGLGEATVSFSGGQNSIELVMGTTKLGYTYSTEVDFKNKSAGGYVHEYVRPWSIGLAAALICIIVGTGTPVLAPIGA